jgi:hypothetical protein
VHLPVDGAFRQLGARAVERGRYALDELVFGSMLSSTVLTK